MKYIKIAFLGIVAVCLIIVAVANRQPVTLRAMPDWLAEATGLAPMIQVPLFAVIFAGVIAGLLIGFIWEWLREHKHRAAVRRRNSEILRLEHEVQRLRAEKHEGEDEVLAILEMTKPGP